MSKLAQQPGGLIADPAKAAEMDRMAMELMEQQRLEREKERDEAARRRQEEMMRMMREAEEEKERRRKEKEERVAARAAAREARDAEEAAQFEMMGAEADLGDFLGGDWGEEEGLEGFEEGVEGGALGKDWAPAAPKPRKSKKSVGDGGGRAQVDPRLWIAGERENLKRAFCNYGVGRWPEIHRMFKQLQPNSQKSEEETTDGCWELLQSLLDFVMVPGDQVGGGKS